MNSIVTSQTKENDLLALTCSIPWSDVEKYKGEALKELGKHVKLDGFREGHIPATVLEKTLSPLAIAEEEARIAIREHYADILKEVKEDVIGAPSISITKLAPGNPLEFSAKFFLAPTVELGDYKKIAKDVYAEKGSIEVTDKEIEDGIAHIRTQWAKSEKWENARKAAEEDPSANGEEVPHFSSITVEQSELPELNDEFAQKIGSFKTVDEFTTKFKESLLEEKTLRERDRTWGEVLEKISNASTFTIPEMLIADEVHRLEHDFMHSLEHTGVTMDQYLEQTNSTKETVEAQWKKDADRRIKTQLILAELAKEEGIEPSEDDINKEAEGIVKSYPATTLDQAKSYARSVLSNRMALERLEEIGKDSKPAKKTTKKASKE